MDSSIRSVANLTDIASGRYFVSVKVVTIIMSQKQNVENGPSNGDSAEPVMPPPRYALDPNGPDEISTVNLKCTDCGMLTVHEWYKVAPIARFPVTNVLEEIVKKSKRLIVCTQCGKYSLKS